MCLSPSLLYNISSGSEHAVCLNETIFFLWKIIRYLVKFIPEPAGVISC
jgi:hypothetical protein